MSQSTHQRQVQQETEEAQHNGPTCPECSGAVREHDNETVCTECGLVVDEHAIREGQYWTPYDDKADKHSGPSSTEVLHDKGLGSDMNWQDVKRTSNTPKQYFRASRLRKLHGRSQFESKTERNRAYANGEILRIATSLGIEQQVREMAARIFREVQEANLIIGRCLDAAAAATLYVAIRCTNSDRPVGEIVNVARGCDSNKIFDLANLYRRELDLKIPLQAISDLLPNYLDDLGIYDRDTEAAIRNVALSIADDLEPMAETSGKSRRGLSAGIVRALVDSSSFDCHLQSISTAHNCSDPTVRERKETIEELIDLEPYLDLLEESLPSKEERTKGSCDQCNRRFETKQDLLFHQQRSPTHEETGGPDVLEVR